VRYPSTEVPDAEQNTRTSREESEGAVGEERKNSTKPAMRIENRVTKDEEGINERKRCMIREVGPSMPVMSAKAEAIKKQGGHTSHEESEGEMGGIKNSTAKPGDDRRKSNDDVCCTTWEVGPSVLDSRTEAVN